MMEDREMSQISDSTHVVKFSSLIVAMTIGAMQAGIAQPVVL
jgi:hypothetical protein